MINYWLAKAKKIECNGLDAEINDFEENKYRGVVEQKEFRLLRYKDKMKKWLKPRMKQALKNIRVKMKIKQKTKSAYTSKYGVERNRNDAHVCSNKECEQIFEFVLILM